MNKPTPPEANNVGTNSKLLPEISGTDVSEFEMIILVWEIPIMKNWKSSSSKTWVLSI